MKFMDLDNRAASLMRSLSLAPSLLLIVACSGGSGGSAGSVEPLQANAPTMAKVGVFMETDLANPSAKRVIVNVDTLTIKSAGDSSVSGIAVNKEVELTENKFALPNITLDEGQTLESREIRLVLHETGNKYIRSDGTVCELKTPSSQQSGLKIKLPESFSIVPGLFYSVHLSFNVEKSIVEQGNGGCLLKPVIKGEIISYRPPVVDDGDDDSNDNDDTDTDTDTNTDPDPGTDTDPGNDDGDVDPVVDVVYQPETTQVVDTVQFEVSN